MQNHQVPDGFLSAYEQAMREDDDAISFDLDLAAIRRLTVAIRRLVPVS